MQGFLSRVARLPSSSCRCRTCLRTYVNGVATHPSAASRRGLKTANAVTALYGSIFAGAAIADAMAKRKRRQEWDDKIAAVQEEIDELMDEERRLLESLSARKPRQLSSTTIQSRLYRAGSSMGSMETRNAQSLANRAFSTNSPAKEKAPAEENSTDDYMDEDNWATITQEADIDKAASAERLPFNETNRKDHTDEAADEDDYEDFEDGFSTMNTIVPRPEPDFVWEQSSIVRIKAIQKLAVQQLVYRFMLRPSVAHDYSGLPVEYRLDDSSGGHSNVLLSRLRGIRQRLYSLKYIRNSPYDDLMPNMDLEELDELRYERERYDLLLKQDIGQYLKGKIRIRQLLSLVSENLSACEDPDRPEAFSLLINFFTRCHMNDLSDMVIKCLVPNLFKLNTPLIVAIITHFRKTKNLKDFDLFLQMLRGEGGYPVNLKTTWVKKNVNGITVTVPPVLSFSPLLITSVITATLRFDQPEKAEAYLHVARIHGFVDNMSTLTAFLRFYGIRKDFESGSSTLVRALNFMVSSSEHEEDRVSRLILCMADFSVRCGRDHLCEMLIDAAVHSGFDCRLAHVSAHSVSETNYLLGTRKRWTRAQRNLAAEFSRQQGLSLHEKCTKFVDLTAAKVIQDQHNVTQNKDDLTPTTTVSSDSLDESQNTEPLPLRWVKSETYVNEKGQPVERDAKIRKLRAQLDFLHQRIDNLSLADGRNGSREDE
ncbi:hypothetical protein DPV78_005199 [Talaromyces pinophilus]|nr:hypothetical protein DPV78_005199 [Talaromyces pinophilus]